MPPEELSIPGFLIARCFDEVGSTMDEARTVVDCIGSTPGAAGLVMAKRQSAGRGRQGRSWSGTDGSFMGTFLFQTQQPAAQLSGYSLAIGVGIARALSGAGVSVALKWPNDIVVVRDGRIRKLGGILTEVQESFGSRILLVGIGLNLSAPPDDVTDALSVRDLSGVELGAHEFVQPLATNLLAVHETFIGNGGFSGFRQEWENLSCFTAGRTMLAVEIGPRISRGTYIGVEDSGALLLACAGATEALHSGHITWIDGLGEVTK